MLVSDLNMPTLKTLLNADKRLKLTVSFHVQFNFLPDPHNVRKLNNEYCCYTKSQLCLKLKTFYQKQYT